MKILSVYNRSIKKMKIDSENQNRTRRSNMWNFNATTGEKKSDKEMLRRKKKMRKANLYKQGDMGSFRTNKSRRTEKWTKIRATEIKRKQYNTGTRKYRYRLSKVGFKAHQNKHKMIEEFNKGKNNWN